MGEFEQWQSFYRVYLNEMFYLFQEESARNKLKFKKIIGFEEFCKFIYSQSSRYYSNYA